jgi:DNA polymerase-3 subunit gamma/tau
MTYLVLARKYRPRTFSELVGQEHVVQALSNALVQQRLHHAYLFTGTRGVGKTTVSRILAKSLNCQGSDGQGGITAEPCGVCQACRDIDAGRFVDYTELDAASNRGVDEVQGLLEQAVYKPVQGRFKVFMIDEVHMLSGHAFNAMLKTLEEPPEYLKFVLATTDPQKVPVTVLSRCLQFNLRPMAAETVFEHLSAVLAQEQVQAEPAALHQLARAARGSMRDALSLTDQAIAFGAGRLQEGPVRQMLGAVDRSHVLQLIEALGQADGGTVVALVDALRLEGVSAAATLEDMGLILQKMAVVQAVAQATVDPLDPDGAAVARLAQLMGPQETQLLYSLCLHGRAELGLAPDEYVALTMVLLRLLAFMPKSATAEKKSLIRSADSEPTAPPHPKNPPAPPSAPGPIAPGPADSAERLDQGPLPGETDAHADRDEASWPAAPSAPAAKPSQRTGPVASPRNPLHSLPVRDPGQPSARLDMPRHAQPLVPTAQGDFWAELVQTLVSTEAVHALVRELALQSQLLERDNQQWTLCIESESLNMSNTRERLETALAAHGHAVRLEVRLGAVTDSPARRWAARAAQRQQAAQDLIENDPLVQSLMRDYGARIVPGSVKPL